MAGIAETAKLVSSLELKDNFTPNANKAMKSLGNLESKSFKVGQSIGKGMNNAARNIGKIAAVGVVALGGAVAFGIKSLGDLQRSQAQTAAVIASTGGKAGVTAAQVDALAESLENVTTVDDKVIRDGENMLLTFTNIGSTVFPAAAKAATDMAVAMAGGNVEAVDLKASSIQLGKALNDPVKGLTALSKVGVSFNEVQTKTIKANATLSKEETKHYAALKKTNKAAAERYKAGVLGNKLIASQKIILAELNTEFGKAGEAAGKGPEAVMRRLEDAGEGVSQILARATLPALERLGTFLTEKLGDKDFLATMDEIGQGLGRAADDFVDFITSVDFKAIGSTLKIAADAAGTLVGWFMKMPTWVQGAVIGGWGLNKLTGGALGDIVGTLSSGLIKGVLGMNAGVVHIKAGTVVGGGGGVPGAGGAAGAGLLGTAAAVAIPVTIAAIASKAAADIANSDFAKQGIKTDFTAGEGPFGIISSLKMIDQGIKLLRGDIKATPTASPFGVDRGADRGGDALRDSFDRAQVTGTAPAIAELKGKIADDLAVQTTAIDAAGSAAASSATNAGVMAANASRTAGATVAAAVANNRPITNVDIRISATTVQQVATVQTRYGSTGGDRTGDTGSHGGNRGELI